MNLKIGEMKNKNDEKYWFTKDKIDKITNVHNYLDSLPQIGKVYLFHQLLMLLHNLNNNKPLGTLEMGVFILKFLKVLKQKLLILIFLLKIMKLELV